LAYANKKVDEGIPTIVLSDSQENGITARPTPTLIQI